MWTFRGKYLYYYYIQKYNILYNKTSDIFGQNSKLFPGRFHNIEKSHIQFQYIYIYISILYSRHSMFISCNFTNKIVFRDIKKFAFIRHKNVRKYSQKLES